MLSTTICNSRMLVLLLLVSLFPPEYILQDPTMNVCMRILKVLSRFVILLMYFSNYKTHFKKKYNIILIALWLELLVPTFFFAGTSLHSWFENTMKVFCACFLIEELMLNTPRKGLWCLYTFFSFCVLSNTISVFLFPDGLYYNEVQRVPWCWILGGDNAAYTYYIIASTVAMLYSHYIKRRTTFICLLVWVSAFAFVFNRQIATGIVCQILWLLLFLGFRFKWFRKLLNARYALYLAVGSFIFVVIGRKFILAPIVTALGRDITLTGRTIIWDTVLKVVSQSPILGYGVHDGGQFDRMFSLQVLGTHNYLLNLLFWGGAIAVILFVLMLYFSCKNGIKQRESWGVKCLTVGLIVCTTRFLTENGYVEFYYMLLTLMAYCKELERSSVEDYVPRKWKIRFCHALD